MRAPQLQVMFRLAADMSLNPLPTLLTLTFWPNFVLSCVFVCVATPKRLYVSHVNLQVNKMSKILLLAKCRGNMKRPSSIMIHRPLPFEAIQKQQAQKSITSPTHTQSTQFILNCCAAVTRNAHFQAATFPQHVKDEKPENMCRYAQLRIFSICELRTGRWRQLCQHSSPSWQWIRL